MQKALLVSILVATMVIPLRAASRRDRAKALRLIDRQLFVFCAAYVIALTVAYPWLKAK